ncbi:uncharacterized protein LTR77_004030 [Saxophila tyrrhenica]|uniref:Uncharacterized protein n=1 Tax=Saxophila tyrrhenica TaxID=1690608 RepID=A0AAV9PCG1_9PEZI|nr:hypothetical protein LTR77_004030 [Saxophila tyrrhenica]
MDKMILERTTREADAAADATKGSASIDLPIREHPQHSKDVAHGFVADVGSHQDLQHDTADQQPPWPRSDPENEPTNLQLYRKKAEEAEAELQRMVEEERKLREWLKACADAKRQKELEELERKRKEAEEKRRQKAKAKEVLMRMGRCPVGYEWIKQSGGYRCAGGSHWIDDGQVASTMR